MSLAHETSLSDLSLSPRVFRKIPDLAHAPAAFRAALWIMARNWSAGAITFVLPSGRALRIDGDAPGPTARLIVRDFRFMNRVLASGDIGFAEGFMADEWDTPDLATLLGVFSLNWDRLERVVEGNALMTALNRVAHLLRPNTHAGSRRNIHAHYDLGNAFYECWLDPSMTYSSALYAWSGQPLAEAQANKYASLARGMDLRPEHRVLEIGCGWGGFAEFAAKEVGAHVTGITISQEQFDYAKKRVFDAGLSERIDIRFVDYRDVTGQFDRVASIEMFEAVGERYWPSYFGKIAQVLKPGGQAGLQVITIRDELFDGYRRRADFIQKYIFPGGMLGAEGRLRQETDRAGLAWGPVVRFGQDYADTLAEWSRRFSAAWPEIAPLGFDERFRRLWLFYLAYCEAGFRGARTNVVQLNLTKA